MNITTQIIIGIISIGILTIIGKYTGLLDVFLELINKLWDFSTSVIRILSKSKIFWILLILFFIPFLGFVFKFYLGLNYTCINTNDGYDLWKFNVPIIGSMLYKLDTFNQYTDIIKLQNVINGIETTKEQFECSDVDTDTFISSAGYNNCAEEILCYPIVTGLIRDDVSCENLIKNITYNCDEIENYECIEDGHCYWIDVSISLESLQDLTFFSGSRCINPYTLSELSFNLNVINESMEYYDDEVGLGTENQFMYPACNSEGDLEMHVLGFNPFTFQVVFMIIIVMGLFGLYFKSK